MLKVILLHFNGLCEQHGALALHGDLSGVAQLGSIFDVSVVTHLIISSATLNVHQRCYQPLRRLQFVSFTPLSYSVCLSE